MDRIEYLTYVVGENGFAQVRETYPVARWGIADDSFRSLTPVQIYRLNPDDSLTLEWDPDRKGHMFPDRKASGLFALPLHAPTQGYTGPVFEPEPVTENSS